MIRLITLQDLERHPELVSQGYSINMNYDFSEENVDPVTDEKEIQKAEKQTPKKIPVKNAQKSKPSKKK